MKEELEGIRMEARAVMALPRISQQNGDSEAARMGDASWEPCRRNLEEFSQL